MAKKSEIADALDREIRRWSEMAPQRLIAELSAPCAYEVEDESGRYQIEARLLENKESYLHLMLSAFDGSLRRFVFPVTRTIIIDKPTEIESS